jgi:hypothetical protein
VLDAISSGCIDRTSQRLFAAMLQKQGVLLRKLNEGLKAKVLIPIETEIEGLRRRILKAASRSGKDGTLSRTATPGIQDRIQEIISYRNTLYMKPCSDELLNTKERLLDALDECVWALQSLIAPE